MIAADYLYNVCDHNRIFCTTCGVSGFVKWNRVKYFTRKYKFEQALALRITSFNDS